MVRAFRSLIVSFLARWKGLTQKEIGAAARMPPKTVSYHLKKDDLEDEVYQRLLAAVRGRPAEVAVVAGCLESLAALDQDQGLTGDEQDAVESGVLDGSRLLRSALAEAARFTRDEPPLDEYPKPAAREPARWQARELWSRIKDRPEDHQLAVIRTADEFQSWALAELLSDESTVQASRSLERAASLARLARAIAEEVRGPQGWCDRVKGYAFVHGPNVLRVAGELKTARAGLEEAKRLWLAGSDPEGVLDPGRLLDLEASLCRDERRFDEALHLLRQARDVSRSPARILIKKGFTLEVMGAYERAIETLLEARLLVDRQGEPRLWYMASFNLGVAYTHVARYGEASELAQQVRGMVQERGDSNEVCRVTWLDGRIEAGLGRPQEARRLLEQARRQFTNRGMAADAALALLEEAVLLLDEGRSSEVKTLARDLSWVLDSKGVYREALAALRLFQEAAEREAASAELARRVLRYFFRARYDQGLRFES